MLQSISEGGGFQQVFRSASRQDGLILSVVVWGGGPETMFACAVAEFPHLQQFMFGGMCQGACQLARAVELTSVRRVVDELQLLLRGRISGSQPEWHIWLL